MNILNDEAIRKIIEKMANVTITEPISIDSIDGTYALIFTKK